MMTSLARTTQAGEACAVVDAAGRFDPVSASQAGVKLDRLLWVRCDGRLDAAFRAADLLLHGGGFGVVAFDLCDSPETHLRRVPLSYWYRFRRAVEGTPTALLVLASRPVAGSCAALQVETSKKEALWRGTLPFPLLEGAVWEAAARKPVFAGSDSVRAQAG
jgi:hypothetical protein